MAAVLEVAQLKKTFRVGLGAKPVHALKGIDFQISQGKITGFLGANGAGKTTSIKCILGLAFPDSGEIRYFGKAELSPEAKSKIGFLPERPYFYDYLTGSEFLRFYGQLSTRMKSADLESRIQKLLERVGLGKAANRPLRSYSKGMLQRVGIAQALIHSPEFIILDEPMTGLDPDGRFEVREIIKETAAQGTAVFFSSHQLSDAESICDELVVLKLGEMVYSGPLDGLLKKASSGFQIQAYEQGQLKNYTAADINEVQAKIDELRKIGAQVANVQMERVTLEEAFVRIGFDQNVGNKLKEL